MRLRSILAFALAAVLSLTAVSVGAERGQADAEGVVVICTGHGSAIVYVDAAGEPVPAPHICPDCVLFVATLPSFAPGAETVAGSPYRLGMSSEDGLLRPAASAAWARAPPLWVTRPTA